MKNLFLLFVFPTEDCIDPFLNENTLFPPGVSALELFVLRKTQNRTLLLTFQQRIILHKIMQQ
jgi:hypothetical protein